MSEINFDGLIGPTHNYSGLSDGNIASKKNFFSVSNPKEAALQGLKKAKILINAGLNQGLFLPHERPFIPGLKKLGFSGDNETILKSAYEYSKVLLSNFSSASSMWAANAATISPSPDTKDGKVHITPANLNTMFHRSLESDFTYTQCKLIFSDTCFVVHKPALSISGYGDEGAANHLRISKTHEDKGFEIFVFGESAFKEEAFAEYQKTSFIKRQALEVSKSVALSHKLDRNNVFYLQQHPRAIDKGSFHNDIVSLSNENIFIAHEKAFLNRDVLNHVLKHLELEVENFNYIEIPDKEIPLDDIISSYLLNSQLFTNGEGEMQLILPAEVQNYENCMQWLDKLKQTSDVKLFDFVNIKQSMMNGGGPACLRLKVILNEDEINKVNKNFILNNKRLELIEDLIEREYRDELYPDDLKDPSLLDESRRVLDELTQIFGTGSIYEFQKL
jgi:succinylarginine dihydrolase